MSPLLFPFFISALALGTTITFISSHWILAWIGLEINTLAILPLITWTSHPRATEAATKYFLVQATAAASLLFASTSAAWLSGHWDLNLISHPFPSSLAILALSIKLGLAPLHSWLPQVLQGLDLTTCLILSTWQKLAPLALLTQLSTAPQFLLTFLGLSSTLVGGLGGLNQTQLRKILAFSSIAQLGWIILILHLAPKLTLLALATYIILTSSIFLSLKSVQGLSILTLGTSWASAPLIATCLPPILFSLGGLPPFVGFIPKWFILSELVSHGSSFTATFLALTSLLSLFFYLRLAYAAALTSSPNSSSSLTIWRSPQAVSIFPLAVGISLSVFGFPLAPFFLAFFL